MTSGAAPQSVVSLTPRGPVLRQQVEERYGVEGLGAEHASTRPGALGEQLEGDDRVDRGLPHHALVAVLAHRPLVVHHVVEVRRPRPAVLTGARDEQAGTGL